MNDPFDEIPLLNAALKDRYVVERELGSGGMATVYLADDVKHKRQVAIKVLRPELTAGLGAERFVREIEIAAKLTHPHILPLFDSGEAGGFLYYVMPYVQGESLRDRLGRERKLAAEEAIRLTDQIASALSYAHDHGVVHRDIKPANILLAAGQAVVADFGIARAIQAARTEGLTRTGVAVGTPAYMSPEQALGEEAVDGRTDVYALGCVVYEMVSGEVPFEGTGPQGLLAKQMMDRPPELRKSDPSVPVFLDRAVARALAPAPDDRFATATAFAKALTTGTVVTRVRGRARRRSALMGVAAAVVALAAWGVFAVTAAPEMERLAVLPVFDLTNDPGQEHLVAGVHEALIGELGRLQLSPVARATMAQYRGTEKGLAEIVRELDADGVIEPSLYRSGDSLEITARLYDRSEQEVWSGSFSGVYSDIISLYRGFARAIADEIRLSLTPGTEARLAEPAPVNPAVHDAYLRGMHTLFTARTGEDYFRAIGYLDQARAENPADGRAWAGLAMAYATIGHDIAPPGDIWARARAAAEQATLLDPTLAEGWAALADYKMYSERDWEGAEQAFRRANELNPSLAMNHYHFAWYLALFGRMDEAFSEHRRAQELDPFTPMHSVYIPALYWSTREYEQALEEIRVLVEQFPQSPRAHFVHGETAIQLGLYEEGIAAYERMVALFPGGVSSLGHAYARAGRTEDALRIAEQLETQPPAPGHAQGLALIYSTLGDSAQALRWLEYEPAHAWLAFVTTSWYHDFDDYREVPRFQALLRRMNLQFDVGDRWPVPLPVIHPELPGLSEEPSHDTFTSRSPAHQSAGLKDGSGVSVGGVESR